jgi:hypothetical protein
MLSKACFISTFTISRDRSQPGKTGLRRPLQRICQPKHSPAFMSREFDTNWSQLPLPASLRSHQPGSVWLALHTILCTNNLPTSPANGSKVPSYYHRPAGRSSHSTPAKRGGFDIRAAARTAQRKHDKNALVMLNGLLILAQLISDAG